MVLWAYSAHGSQLQGSKRGIYLAHFTLLLEPNPKSVFFCVVTREGIYSP